MSIGQFIPKKYLQVVESGKVSWSSPSNIALVKYWGKEGNQIPKNPSVSFTLENCKTITTLSFTRKEVRIIARIRDISSTVLQSNSQTGSP